MDLEQLPAAERQMHNTTVRSIAWRGVTVTVQDRDTKQTRTLVDDVEGIVEAGECLGLMGPSGCGKTTLLNALAKRRLGTAVTEAEVLVNGRDVPVSQFRQISSFVESRDALTGSLTVFETVSFSAKLSSSRQVCESRSRDLVRSALAATSWRRDTADSPGIPSYGNKRERLFRVNALLDALGLSERKNALIGTPARKGISDGQKRRVSIASQLITGPKILFLDEPTSGLDSVASFEVIRHLRDLARRHNIIVVCSIHQPSSSTFNLFDKVMLLSAGRTQYFGAVSDMARYYEGIGVTIPQRVNPAEFLLEMANVDFAQDKEKARKRLGELHDGWRASKLAHETRLTIKAAADPEGYEPIEVVGSKPGLPVQALILIHRSIIKSYRDIFAYGIRLAMYVGLAVMMGTVWVRLSPTQASIQPFINAIFFGCAFMSFMAVAYVPAFLEDYLQFVKEHRNGLYGPFGLIVSNFLVGVPYLFGISVVFSVITYWLSNFQPTATAFFTWVMWLFLDLLAAESLVVFVTSLIPNFVASLAVVAFMNGLWMSVGGFMVPPTSLNAFYKYVFHYWDYQKYVFESMMINEFANRSYDCGETCRCMYESPLADQCRIAGSAVLTQYGYETGKTGQRVGIMISIVFGYRLAAWAVLRWKS